MKIGIITYWQSLDNYGQQLQCYALQSLLRSWGHDAFLIRYAPEERKTVWRKILNHLKHPEYFLNHLPFETARKREVKEEKLLKQVNDQKNPLRQFDIFRKEHLKMTVRIYTTYAELQSDPPEANIYITGSDQVWHDCYNEESVLGWFLQFGNQKVKRISYAASIGRDLHDKELPLFRQFLSCFDAISVREQSTCALCQREGIRAQVCLDPTLLLSIDNYRQLASPVQNAKPYAFIYVLNVKTADDFYWPQIRDYLKERGIMVKSVTGSGYCQGRELIKNNTNLLATIPEWLGYIEHAQCIFTTSYHGTLFSILMHRPFVTIRLCRKYESSNTRIDQLLSMLGLSERIFDPEKPIRGQMELPIDWDAVDCRLDSMRKTSMNFLIHNLKCG